MFRIYMYMYICICMYIYTDNTGTAAVVCLEYNTKLLGLGHNQPARPISAASGNNDPHPGVSSTSSSPSSSSSSSPTIGRHPNNHNNPNNPSVNEHDKPSALVNIYEGEVQFITKQEWFDELTTLLQECSSHDGNLYVSFSLFSLFQNPLKTL